MSPPTAERLPRDGTGRGERDLDEALRQSGPEHVAGTRPIVPEPTGGITVPRKAQGR